MFFARGETFLCGYIIAFQFCFIDVSYFNSNENLFDKSRPQTEKTLVYFSNVFFFIALELKSNSLSLSRSFSHSLSGVEHSGEGIFGRRSHNAKLFERIEHSGSRQGIKM